MIETPKEAAKRLAGPMLIKGYVPAALHAYTDEQGEALYWRIRAKHPSTGEKWIRPMRLNGRGYEFGEPKYPEGKPLYALHRIASNPDAAIWIAEGEQKADALNKLGLVATTTGGATSAGTANWRPLKGRACIIWPDNDEPGKAYAGEVASILLGLGCSVQCVAVDKLGLAEGEDAIQWLEARPTASGSDLEGLPMLAPTPSPENAPKALDWPEPLPIPDALPPVAAFNPSLLPESLRPWIEDIAERVQCPPDFAAVGAMISLAAVVGRKIGIRPKRKDDWLEVPNLWGAIVGRPGVMKSPALREAMRPLKMLDAKAAEAFRDEAATWHRAQELAKLKRMAAQSNALKLLKGNKEIDRDALGEVFADDEPQARRYVVNDCSVEALGEIRGASLREELVNDLALAWVDAVARGDAVKARGEDFDLGAGERIDGFGVGHGSAEIKNAARRAQGRLRPIAKGPRERGCRQPASSTLRPVSLRTKFQAVSTKPMLT